MAKMMKSGMTCDDCMDGYCHNCRGWKKLVLGLVVLANVYWPFAEWATLIGILLVLGGLMKLVMPKCSHCM